MKKPLSDMAASIVAGVVFVLVAIIAFLLNFFWAGLVLALGIALALRQFLMIEIYEAILTLVVFGFTFILYQFNLMWGVLVPAPLLAAAAALFLLLREIFKIIDQWKTKE